MNLEFCLLLCFMNFVLNEIYQNKDYWKKERSKVHWNIYFVPSVNNHKKGKVLKIMNYQYWYDFLSHFFRSSYNYLKIRKMPKNNVVHTFL